MLFLFFFCVYVGCFVAGFVFVWCGEFGAGECVLVFLCVGVFVDVVGVLFYVVL